VRKGQVEMIEALNLLDRCHIAFITKMARQK